MESASQAMVREFGLGNYAWNQHFIHNFSPVGVAGFVMANGSM